MAVLDYKSRVLHIRSVPVTPMTMVGFAAEDAFKACRGKSLGLSGLEERHLPADLSLTLDRLGLRQVKCHQPERALGLEVAKAVRVKLHNLGLEMAAACVEVRQGDKKVGEHDLVCEIVTDSGGGAPGPEHPFPSLYPRRPGRPHDR